jgi:hypothetical protein
VLPGGGALTAGTKVSDVVQTWLQNSIFGTSKPVQGLVTALMTGDQLKTEIQQNMMYDAKQAVAALSPEQYDQFNRIMLANQTHGDQIAKVLADPRVDLPVKEAITTYLRYTDRFLREEASAASDTLSGARQADGTMGLYATKQSDAVVDARNAADAQRKDFIEGAKVKAEDQGALPAVSKIRGLTPESTPAEAARAGFEQLKARKGLDGMNALVSRSELLDRHALAFAPKFEQAIAAAEDAIPKDDQFLANIIDKRKEITTKGKEREVNLPLGTKKDSALAVVGMARNALEDLRNGHIDDLAIRVDAVASKMTRWGYHEMDVADTGSQALLDLKSQVTALQRYVKERTRVNDEIDRRIEGEYHRVGKETKDQIDLRERQTADLKQHQALERGQLKQATYRALSLAREKTNAHLEEAAHWYAAEKQKLYDGADIEADMHAMEIAVGLHEARNRSYPKFEKAVGAMADQVYQRARSQERRLLDIWQRSQKYWRDELEKDERKITEQFRTKTERMRLDHEKQTATLEDLHDYHRTLDGEILKEASTYMQRLGDFHQAVYDHPPDQWMPMRRVLFEKHLMEAENKARAVDFVESRLRTKSGWTETAIEKLHENHDILRELVHEAVDDVVNDPDAYDPELVDVMKEMKTSVEASALEELHKLWAGTQHYHGGRLEVEGRFQYLEGTGKVWTEGKIDAPIWLPAADTFDRISQKVTTFIGKGEPKVDVAFARANKYVNTRHDVVLGVTKAINQTLEHDAHIEFLEHYIAPIVLKGADIRDFLRSITNNDDARTQALLGIDLEKATVKGFEEADMKRIGLRKFDPHSLFGFTLPRFGEDALYLPSGLVKALEGIRDQEQHQDHGLWDKGMQVFRYSILGLSPRYTAHILFGGSMLLALRSTAYMPSILLDAVRALRNGEVDQTIFRQPTQEGYGRFNFALTEHARAGGRQLGTLLAQENLEVTQGVKLYAAKPAQWLKALADVNFRLTRHITRMQSAVAYFDYAARAERRGYFTDAMGNVVTMTKERAAEEAQHHVTEVFGNLRSMSPFERGVAKWAVPFYGWERHILKYVFSYPFDHPWRAQVLGLMAYENSANVPKGLPERIQLLFFLGSPNAQGKVNAIDDAFMDPLRDVANYATLGGLLQSLNPAALSVLATFDPQMVYGSNVPYPNLTYDQFYGISVAGTQGTALSGLEQFVPQLGAMGSAIDLATQYRVLGSKDKASFIKKIYQDLNIPFAQVQPINVKQMAATAEIARYTDAKQAATNAWQSGDFSSLAGYSSVPNPVNPDYEITPAQLQALYNQALALYPGEAPSAVVMPPPTPPGF